MKEQAKGAVICWDRIASTGNVVKDCEMHIQTDLVGDSLTFFIIEYNEKASLLVEGYTKALKM